MAATSDGISQSDTTSVSGPSTLTTLATDNLPIAVGFVVLFVVVVYAFALACLRCCVSELSIHSAKTYFWFLTGCCLLPYSCLPRPDDEEAWRVRQAKKLASRDMKASRQRQADLERQQTELLRRDFAKQQALRGVREMGENRDDVGLTHSSGKKPPITLSSHQTRAVSALLPVPMGGSLPLSANRSASHIPHTATVPLRGMPPQTEFSQEEDDRSKLGYEQPTMTSPNSNPFGPPLQSRKSPARSPLIARTPSTPRAPRLRPETKNQRPPSIGASTIFVKKKAEIRAKRDRQREIRRQQKEEELADRERRLQELEERMDLQRQKERDRKAQEDIERDEIDRENFERLQKAEIEMQQEQEELAERFKEERRKRKEEKERRRELEEEHRAMLEREEELAHELEEKERVLFEMEEERRMKEAQKRAKREAMMQMEQSGYYGEGQQTQPQLMPRQRPPQISRPMARPIQQMPQQRQTAYDPRMAQQQQILQTQAMQQQSQMRMMPQYSQAMMQRPMQAMQPMMQYPPQQGRMLMPQQYQQFGYR